ncbi:MAG: thioredoxin domain-containing protein [bacterium JZ-2024 1]
MRTAFARMAGVTGFAGLVFFGIFGAADRYASLEERIAQLESQNEALTTQLANIRKDLTTVQQLLAKLNDKVSQLETKVANSGDAGKKKAEYDFPVPEGLRGEEDLAAVTIRSDAPVKGNPRAGVVIAEFSDFQCPFCAKFFRESLPRIQMDYIDKGLVRMYYLHLPLQHLHPQALPAAIASECAARWGRFWEMHDLIFQNQTMLQQDDLKRYLASVGVDPSRYDECAKDGQIVARIQADMTQAQEIGLTGTPSFIVGVPLPDGRIVGKRIVGAHPYSRFKSDIERMLAIAARNTPERTAKDDDRRN